MDASIARSSATLLVLSVLLAAVAVADGPPAAELRVAADGSGDFTSIQAALDSIPVDNAQRIVISVAPGLYSERVRIDHDFVTLRGSGPQVTTIAYRFPREEYHRRYDRFGPGVLNVFGEDIVVEQLCVENTQQLDEHAFAIYGQPQRFVLDNCHVLGKGGDTLSLWNTSYGMYYHRNCVFRGGVDFVCPRGWCYIRDSKFESVNTSAAIWQDGHMNLDMKFVLANCEFDGPEQFWIGRNHYPSQFYLLGCRFAETMSNRPIELVGEVKPYYEADVYQRKFFHDCHRAGGDYDWFADNLDQAPGSPQVDEINADWTFDGKWNPERTDPPTIDAVETDGARVHVYFSEPVACHPQAVVVRQDGTEARLTEGMGTSRLVFSGGSASSEVERLQTGESPIYAVTATLASRELEEFELPKATAYQRRRMVLVGDSTVATYDAKHAYQGWGTAFDKFFDDRITVVNHAQGGRSSKSFRDEGLWKKALADDPDFVVIQFGHNDNPGKGPKRETDPAAGGSYRENLRRYVRETRAQGAEPILVSPPTRRVYLGSGIIDPEEANVPYAKATAAVARELECAFVDLNAATRELFNRLEESHSDWMQPVGDRTHFTPAGSRRIAQLVAAELDGQVESLETCIIRRALQRP